MKLLSQINVHRERNTASIQLLQGDLSALPKEHESDLLVVAAFPGDYMALTGSLFKALQEKNFDIRKLADHKAIDLRDQLNCWLSQPLSTADQNKFHFKRILCFEPGRKINEPKDVVGDIFRCINTFAFDDDNDVIAMPLIGTGYQQVPVEKMLPALLEVAYFWLKNGLPLQCVKLVVRSDEKAIISNRMFEEFKLKLASQSKTGPIQPPAPPSIPASPSDQTRRSTTTRAAAPTQKPPVAPSINSYDYFLSYAHVHAKEVQLFVEELKKRNADLAVFYDKDSIPAGGLWIQQISAAIQQSKKVLVFLSPDYDKSPVCWDEFQCAKLMEYNRKKNIIQTVYLYSHKETELPVIMGIYSYIDCREGSAEKIRDCVIKLAGAV